MGLCMLASRRCQRCSKVRRRKRAFLPLGVSEPFSTLAVPSKDAVLSNFATSITALRSSRACGDTALQSSMPP